MRKPKFDEYYIAEVSWRPGNPIHRVIAIAHNANYYTIYSFGYECPREVCPKKDLHYFKLIERIESMNKEPSSFLPPDDRTVDEWKVN